ncbi:MAG TPA: SAM-dependent chlorinase/fluorinase [Thioalkalivibrio sp.]|nr:SAM-dependent chlorinase/fluorinase [Thioalkalivibrio sp.]
MFVIFSDFGSQGPYLGQVRAVLHGAEPGVPVVDACCDAPSFDPRASAHLLAALGDHYPVGSVWTAVVDPGVGSDRHGLVLEAGGRWYVGPDNGLLSQVAGCHPDVRVWRILGRPERLSKSFHGRDWFAPVAARLARHDMTGMQLIAVSKMVGHDWVRDLSAIIYVDHYGNLMTGLRGETVPSDAELDLGSLPVKRAETFSSVPRGHAFWYINSMGLVEIAVNQGRAEALLGMGVGDAVTW